MARTYVELVEDDEHLRPDEEHRSGLVDVVRRHPARALTAAVVAVVVVGGAVVAQLVVDARERAQLAALADEPGFLAPVELPMRSVFVADGDAASAVQNGVRVGDLLVGGTYEPVAVGPHVLAVDPATGAVVWDVTVDLPPAAEPEPEVQAGSEPSGTTWCTAPEGEPSRVACVVSRSYGWQSDDGRFGHEVAVRALVVLDASDGSVVERRDEPLGAELFVGDDAYWVASIDPDRRGVQVVERGYDDAEHWSTHVDAPAELDQDTTPAVMADDTRTVLSLGTTAWLLGADGTPGHRLGGGTGPGWVSLVPDGVLIMRYDQDGAQEGGGVLWHADGTSRDMTGFDPAPIYVDDGSRPGATFTTDSSIGPLVRRDRAGAVLWKADVTLGSWSFLVRGTVVVAGGSELAAVDADDGDVLWKTTLPAPADQLFTDGRVVLVPNGRVVRAYGIDDGERRWSAQLVERDGEYTLQRMATDDPTADVSAPYSDGWWNVTPAGQLAYSLPTADSTVVVLG
ncbi:hypothetical protein Cch01nite_25100 [Cellulomonas chitinilytica]|uniref:Pyrrolo-quinoline quinone repeat domain-containing protein n=1 Tax=Cellulomonas chitinilytica TaxID=398759 RepID=A0A919U1W7_9CELL|nr:PQQ-binding-like beta-propeller repeat protein [Cellulomonas chitinilytica]GIG21786.1 hypothetical protein Cch01nite_25100 [Cellulomonas chitinilytica]